MNCLAKISKLRRYRTSVVILVISFPGAFNFVQPELVIHDLLNGLDLDCLSYQLLLSSVVSFVKVILVG